MLINSMTIELNGNSRGYFYAILPYVGHGQERDFPTLLKQ